ncbi:NH(3)-dependent NAD(+) synthetase [Leuconostoc gasicomitatum]|uniref:NH(3)-dependent NAD(+) synthetase n=2 Tax=Leuconostoc TaxID=1243 RepID=A0AAN2QXC4_9LACO|nr:MULTISPECIES: ammonia-dependent NAD(+) synthetase [Leuconostoc]MBZ5947287.1 ammonia-dependent NAD(+) synthetase [Leuconostoc gasicomitatum]MBZ5956346.1 ammonia-dependent NAD(+) synthetase [Leuconostoc gasicomitatum]MBZ5959245.1 ammonia-dependent NAD(+) synthetase [Leuconostoc gasicomitatum]MBZ5959842.1 ammonia-dependent NAD(+) synthetase [Leuconostoc gasicomitatum]MBZ5962173.1 ammonia-dependent NAD(+) synthetase [Leuconostoc gasicomitatum]
MRPLQAKIIADLHVQPLIDPLTEIRRSVDFLKQYLQHNPQYTSCIIAVSGGQDSTLAGKIAKIAIDELNVNTTINYELIAVRQPYGKQRDESDAISALNFIQPSQIVTTNIKTATDAMTLALQESGLVVNDLSRGSIKPKMRMIAQYAVAREYQGIVIGTDHAAEAFAGFFTKYGDGGTDVNPLWRLNKRQGRDMLKTLGAPKVLYDKTPTADLEDDRPQLPDEIALGVTYDCIDDYLEGKNISTQDAEKIEHLYLTSAHKRHEPVTIYDTWFY